MGFKIRAWCYFVLLTLLVVLPRNEAVLFAEEYGMKVFSSMKLAQRAEEKGSLSIIGFDGEPVVAQPTRKGLQTQPKSEYDNVPGISNLPAKKSVYDGVPGISDLPPANNPFDENQPVTNVPGTSSGNQATDQASSANPERDALLNDLRFGVKRAREKMAADDPTLEETLIALKGLMEKFRSLREDSDNSEYLRDLQIIKEAEKAVAGRKADANAAGVAISDEGKQQMANIVAFARTHNTGYSGGNCFNAVWGYLTSSGYGKLQSWGDLPAMQSGEARNFAEYLNSSRAHLEEAGLQRLDTSLNPRLTNPHDSRIPVGAIIVVAAGSYGTRNPTAGDIVVKAGSSHFINDGPNMDYGSPQSWYGKVLGVYVPR